MHFFEPTSSVKDLGQQRPGWTVKMYVFGLRREECSNCAACYSVIFLVEVKVSVCVCLCCGYLIVFTPPLLYLCMNVPFVSC